MLKFHSSDKDDHKNDHNEDNKDNKDNKDNINNKDNNDKNIKQELEQEIKSNANNGLITKIWGPPSWKFLHCVSFGYPLNPTNEQKNDYMTFYKTIGKVLPCKYCRDSYNNFILVAPTLLDMEVMKNRATLTEWLYKLHNVVNNKLTVDYGLTYNDICDKYENYRAVCNNTKQKTCMAPIKTDGNTPYKIAQVDDCPIIYLNISKLFRKYAKMRNCNESDYKLIEHMIKNNIDLNDIKYTDLWCDRNKECMNLIFNMRSNQIPSLEQEGKWIGLPTIEELKLIMRLSSNISNTELFKIAEKLPYRKNVKYILTK